MHLRSAWIGEADVHTARNQRPHQTFRTVHLSTLWLVFRIPVQINHCSRVSSKVWPGIAGIAAGMLCFLTEAFENAAITGSLVAQAAPDMACLEADSGFSQGEEQ